MRIKLFLMVLLMLTKVLVAIDIYPSDLPDVFWSLRDHFYERIARPNTTVPYLQSTLNEFARVCDFIPSNPITNTNIHKDIEQYSLFLGVEQTVKAEVIDLLDQLDTEISISSREFYEFGEYSNCVEEGGATCQEASDLYPKEISSFFWVARNKFYEEIQDYDKSTQMLRDTFCTFISIGDYVAYNLFMYRTLRQDFDKFSKIKKIGDSQIARALDILSELETLDVYFTRPIPGYTALKTPEELENDKKRSGEFEEYLRKRRKISEELIAELTALQVCEEPLVPTVSVEFFMPKQIADRLKVNIKGQDAAMDALGIIGHKIMAQIHLKQKDVTWNFRAPHTFLLGKSGCGKTQSVIELCKIIGIPWIRINAPEVVGEGFKGPTLSYHYEQLKQSGTISPYAIIILDEAGKMGRFAKDDDAPKYGASIMRTLLAHMDGALVKIHASPDGSEKMISTECFTYLATDACAHIPDSVNLNCETLVKYTGMPRELVNRFNHGIIQLKPHTIDSLTDILVNSPNGAYSHAQEFFKKLYDIDLVIEDDGLKAISTRSIAESTGARKLEEMLQHIFAPLYSLPNELIKDVDGAKRIILDKRFVEERLPPRVEVQDDKPPFGMYC